MERQRDVSEEELSVVMQKLRDTLGELPPLQHRPPVLDSPVSNVVTHPEAKRLRLGMLPEANLAGLSPDQQIDDVWALFVDKRFREAVLAGVSAAARDELLQSCESIKRKMLSALVQSV